MKASTALWAAAMREWYTPPIPAPAPPLTPAQLDWQRIHAALAKWNKLHGRTRPASSEGSQGC